MQCAVKNLVTFECREVNSLNLCGRFSEMNRSPENTMICRDVRTEVPLSTLQNS